jgi:hypothetical protein
MNCRILYPTTKQKDCWKYTTRESKTGHLEHLCESSATLRLLTTAFPRGAGIPTPGMAHRSEPPTHRSLRTAELRNARTLPSI